MASPSRPLSPDTRPNRKPPTHKPNHMNRPNCPHCGAKLGNFLYADACPHCHVVLAHNTKPLLPAQTADPIPPPSWLTRCFVRILRLVEG